METELRSKAKKFATYPASDSVFSLNSMKRIINSVSDFRVSEDSANRLGIVSQEFGLQVAEKAVEIAEENERVTVRKEDVREALRNLSE